MASISMRQIYRIGQSLANRNICGNTGFLTSSLCHGTISNNKRTGLNPVSDHNINERTLSTTQKSSAVPMVYMGSILEHHKYKDMKSELSKMNRKSLRPLDTASLYILSFKDLTVNLELLSLDALSTQSHSCPSHKGFAEIKEMKQGGAVKKGKLNKEDETAIEKRFETLLAETGLDKEALMEEMFAVNKSSGFNNWDEDFMLKRQLAGFWLLSGMKDGCQWRFTPSWPSCSTAAASLRRRTPPSWPGWTSMAPLAGRSLLATLEGVISMLVHQSKCVTRS